MASTSRWSTSAGFVSGEGGGCGDEGGGRFRLFGAWIQGPCQETVNDGAGDGVEGGGESSHQCQAPKRRRCRGPGRRPKNTAMPWTVEEHRRFLRGLEEKGKGNWKVIAKEFVKTRNGTQVASHAQKYFLRLQAAAARPPPRGLSIFDVSLRAGSDGIDDADAIPGEESQGTGGTPTSEPPPPLLLSCTSGPVLLAAPLPAPEMTYRGSSTTPSSPQRTPSPSRVAPPPRPYEPLALGIAVGHPPPTLHLAAVSNPPAFLSHVMFAPWTLPNPASPWEARWLPPPGFATYSYGNRSQQQRSISFASQDSVENDANPATTAASAVT